MSDVYEGRNAAILRATIDGTEYTDPPQSVIEELLIELKETIEAGGGGGGGTTNYNGLSNKPQINGVTLQGNKLLADLGINIPPVDAALDGTSENPVQNKVVKGALDGKQNKLIFDSTPTAGSNNPVTSGGVKAALDGKQDELTFDSTPTANSNNPVTSGGVKAAFNGYYTKAEVDTLVNAIKALDIEVVATLPTTDISTTTIYLVPKSQSQTQNVYDEYLYINNAWELIGSTAIDLSNYYTKTQTDDLLADKQDELTFDAIPTASSNNPVTSDGIKTAIDAVNNKLYSSIAGVAQNNKGSMELYSKNLNTITTSGFYNAMTCTNAPFSYCALIVCGYYLDGYCFQLVVDIQTGEIKTRVQTAGTWSAWTGGNNIVYND